MLLGANRIVGALLIHTSELRHFDEDDVFSLHMLATEAAFSYERLPGTTPCFQRIPFRDIVRARLIASASPVRPVPSAGVRLRSSRFARFPNRNWRI